MCADVTTKNVKEVIWQICPESQCPFSCSHCMARQSDPSELPLEEKLIVLRSLSRSGAPTVALTGGEPLLHPELGALIEAFAGMRETDGTDSVLYVCTTGVAIESIDLDHLSRCGVRLRVSFHTADSTPGLFSISSQHLARVLSACSEHNVAVEVNTLLMAGFAQTARVMGQLMRGRTDGILWNIVSPYPTESFDDKSQLWPTEEDRQNALAFLESMPIARMSSFIISGQLLACRPPTYLLFINTLGYAAKCLSNPGTVTHRTMLLYPFQAVYAEAVQLALDCCERNPATLPTEPDQAAIRSRTPARP